ncbi:MAG: insulinase family protein [Pseudomonadota bacterium]
MESTNEHDTRDMNNPGIKPGDSILDYRVVRRENLAEIGAVYYELEHTGTGARHIHISSQDTENTFGVMFRTVPSDSTGVAHILEHTVLCGSERYNVRDPFFSMLKRGLSTFMNAFTASDWTMYPFSTQNRKDYYNLMAVYLDAAFFPRLDELSFKQEGHRLELVAPGDEEGESALEYKGVVYNEMKGAMSSPGQVMGRALLKELYPSTTYSFNSGGDPSDIPRLTHEDLKGFHARFYHPSNAFFYTYGCLPLADHLRFIQDRVLSRFTAIDPDTRVASQPRWSEPRTAEVPYPLDRDENPEKKYQACVAWLTEEIQNSFEMLVLTVLEQVLLGNASSPLRKALIDSGLGSALCDATGFDPDNRDTMFACGLKDIARTDVSAVETIIFDTLASIVDKGIDPTSVESAVHQIEFQRKEITNTPHPYGIKLVLSFAGTWIHEGDPVSCITFDADLLRLKQALEAGPFLENRIKHYFLDNPHRVLFVLAPDQSMEEAEERRTRQELADLLSRLAPEDLDKIRDDARRLEELQDAQEDVSCLPTLELQDVPPLVTVIRPDAVDAVRPTTCYEKSTSGILYFSCPTDFSHLSRESLLLIPFFCKAFAGSGTARRDYAEMAERMDLYTGGISLTPFAGTGFSGTKDCMPFLALQGKALDRNIAPLFDIVAELVVEYSFSDLQRLKSLLLQYRASLEASIVSSGHMYAMSLAARNFTQASYLGELWHGIYQYRFVRELTDKLAKPELESDILTALSRDLGNICASVFTKGHMNPAIVGSRESLVQADSAIGELTGRLPENNLQPLGASYVDLEPELPMEGWSTGTSVSFVAQAFKTVRMGHEDAPSLSVISKMLRSLYLHREIREKGGAYGGFASYNPEEGIFSFGSYRDPNIRRTLDVYQKASDFITGGNYTDEDVKEAILQVCSDIDKPETPGPASIKAFYRDKLMLSDAKRQAFKASLLALTRKRIRESAERYFNNSEKRRGTAVISSQDKLADANKNLAPGQFPLKLAKI